MCISSRQRRLLRMRYPTVVLLLALVGCDPLYGVYLVQPVAPTPPSSCIASALTQSPMVAEWSAPRGALGSTDSSRFLVFFLDATAGQRRPVVGLFIDRSPEGRPALRFIYEARGGPTPQQRAEIQRFAARFAPEAAAICGIQVEGPLMCTMTGLRGRRPCPSA
jgi:hypothetical protein